MLHVIIDNGHGRDTKGKCSPDGRLLEWEYTRRLAGKLADAVGKKGMLAHTLVWEDVDVPLKERVKRANSLCAMHGKQNCVLISLHVNAAASDGKWHDASGWSVYVARDNASKASKEFAANLLDAALGRGLTGNRCLPREGYWRGNFAIVRDTHCPAVLTENLFQDNRGDVDLMLSEEGMDALVELHLEAIQKYRWRNILNYAR